jgi:hypothetical protein
MRGRKGCGAPYSQGKIHRVIDDPCRWRGRGASRSNEQCSSFLARQLSLFFYHRLVKYSNALYLEAEGVMNTEIYTGSSRQRKIPYVQCG